MSPDNDSTVAANGRPVRENFIDWFGQSKVRHADGSPRVVYRGEHGEAGSLRTALASIAFAADPSVASGYAEDPNDPRISEIALSPRVMPVYLSIQNPIIHVSRPWVDQDDLRAKLGTELADYFMQKYDYSGGYGFGRVEAFYLLDHAEFVDAAKQRGFDGALYWGPYREGDDVEEFRVFDPCQVKSALGNSGLFLPNSTSLTDQEAHRALTRAHEAKRMAEPHRLAWLESAVEVSDAMDALEAASADAPYILEEDDFGADVAWVVADVPIEQIHIGRCVESEEQRQDRLNVIRAVPPHQLSRPILTLDSHGKVGLLDGGHRIQVAKERGQMSVSALVKCDADLARSLLKRQAHSTHRSSP